VLYLLIILASFGASHRISWWLLGIMLLFSWNGALVECCAGPEFPCGQKPGIRARGGLGAEPIASSFSGIFC